MLNFHRAIAAFLLICILPLGGCTTGDKAARDGHHDRAYIAYWPPPSDGSGLRVAVKDLIDMKGIVTTAGSRFLARNSRPAERDAACLRRIRGAGVQIVGKTNLTELAVGVSGINDYYGTPKNRVNPKRKFIPGGSSSGSAVAVQNGTADIAIGTDTAGSIRVPAACCGIVGLKTTFGLIPLDGVYPISPTYLDTVGPMAKDVARTAQGMDLLQEGFAVRYRNARAVKPSAKTIRVGRLYLAGTASEVDRAVDDALKQAGFQVVPLGKDFQDQWKQASSDGNTVAAASAWMSDLKFRNEPGISLRTRAVVALGAIEYRLNYRGAVARRAAWKATLQNTFQRVDMIALPTLQSLPPRVPFFGGSAAFEALVLGKQNTVAVNYGGVPAIAVPIPVGDKDGTVTSLQLVGPRLSEAALLNAARFVEENARSPAHRP